MKAARLRREDLGESWVQRLNQASLMASVPFARLWESVGGTPIYWAIRDGADIVALLPGVEFRPSPLTRFQAMPDGLFAHVVAIDDASAVPRQVMKAILDGLLHAGYAQLYLTDYFGEFELADKVRALECSTTVVPINAEFEPPDAKLRSEIRKAEREGITVQNFDPASHMNGFLRLMHESEARHGRGPRYSDTFFASLAELAALDQRVKWLYVEHEGQPVVSHIYFVERDTLLNWQIYFDKRFSSLKANQYLLYSSARAFAGPGVTKLNLGMTPVDAEGVKTYKDKWGGEPYHYRQISATSMFGRFI